MMNSASTPWLELADRILEGHRLTAEEGLAILRSSDAEILEVMAAAYRVRRAAWGNRVHLNFLMNAKSGMCGEDCGYCAQSRTSEATIDKYNLVDEDQIFDGARVAAQRQAGTYCVVISGRAPHAREVDVICSVAERIKKAFPLKLCASVGLLTAESAARLKAAGVDRVNHNLNTSERFYPHICTTHGYQDRVNTLRAVRAAGLEICSGGIVGMGEEDTDVVELAMRLAELEVEATPINFLIPIPGIRLEKNAKRLTPYYCLKVLALVRLSNPKVELRIAGGREIHLGSLQPLGLFAANSMFVGDYLTTQGQAPEEDYRMVRDLGFEVVVEGAE